MTEDPLTALQRHFEEQYGRLELPGSKSKKRKRGQIDVEPQEEVVVESEAEWLSVRDDTCALEATVITFTEHHEVIEESPVTTHNSFMVNRFLEPAENSPPRSPNLQFQRKRHPWQQKLPRTMTRQSISKTILLSNDFSVSQIYSPNMQPKTTLNEYAI
jgi:hypothetical protein